jgi:hypothetical protein
MAIAVVLQTVPHPLDILTCRTKDVQERQDITAELRLIGLDTKIQPLSINHMKSHYTPPRFRSAAVRQCSRGRRIFGRSAIGSSHTPQLADATPVTTFCYCAGLVSQIHTLNNPTADCICCTFSHTEHGSWNTFSFSSARIPNLFHDCSHQTCCSYQMPLPRPILLCDEHPN